MQKYVTIRTRESFSLWKTVKIIRRQKWFTFENRRVSISKNVRALSSLIFLVFPGKKPEAYVKLTETSPLAFRCFIVICSRLGPP